MSLPSTDTPKKKSIILSIFEKDMIKRLYEFALRVDIADNNDKAEIIREMLGPTFEEIGTGTNRIAFLHNGILCLIAMDRRGLVDNFTEYKRSCELPMFLPKVYECNMLILIEEYVNLMDQEQFLLNEVAIKEVLAEISKAYIFEDIGFALKNSCNWGYREVSNGIDGDDAELVILDCGYLYPNKGQDRAYSCPICKGQLKYNSNYTGFDCVCGAKYKPMDIRRRMDLDLENFENQMIAELNNVSMINFDNLGVLEIQ